VPEWPLDVVPPMPGVSEPAMPDAIVTEAEAEEAVVTEEAETAVVTEEAETATAAVVEDRRLI